MKDNLVIETGENTALPGIIDAFAKSIVKKAKDYLGLAIKNSRTTKIYTIQGKMSAEETNTILEKIFQKPTKAVMVNRSLIGAFSTAVWWGLKLGVKDTEGEVAKEAIEEILGRKIGNVYVSQILYLEGKLKEDDLKKIISLIANPNVERWEIIPREKWNFQTGIGPRAAEVKIDKKPKFGYINLDIPEKEFTILNIQNNWALSVLDFRFLAEYFYKNKEFRNARKELGLKDITDVEIECLAQVWSDHCSHRTINAWYEYLDSATGKRYAISNPFRRYIKEPTEILARDNPWVVSVLKDNAGAMFLDANGEYIVGIKVETHNSPTWKDAYGGAYTGKAGVDRDPFGLGRGIKVIGGIWGISTASRNYDGVLIPEFHPRQIHDGAIAGVRDAGNKHGFPTIYHNTCFDESYLGKGHLFAGSFGISPRMVAGKPIEEKWANPGDLVVIYGGRTGIDGIHGVTEASKPLSGETTMGHVQKGDSYTQRKLSEALEQATAAGLINLSWDLGGGGLSSSITETARFSNGIEIHLDKVLLKYQGLDWWQILLSESQERMLAAISPENIDRFMEIAELHSVDVSVIGTYTNSGAVHIKALGQTVAYLPLKLLHDDPPQWKFKAVWIPPEQRLFEPAISEPTDYNALLKEILDDENICGKVWIMRQFDSRVKGQSVIPQIIGENENVEGPASVIRPILERDEGITVTEAVNPRYSIIDTYWMTINVFDKILRSVAATSGVRFKNGKPERIGILDNYCWPDIRPGPDNPDAEYKAAQFIRSLKALKTIQKKWFIPLLSGKDSMYIRGEVKGKFGEKHNISGLPCIQGTAIASVDNVAKCLMPQFEIVGDLICVIGSTKNELGGSIAYQKLGYVGLNIPKPDIEESMRNVKAVSEAIDKELLSAVHPVVEGGLAVALAKMAIAGDIGAKIDLRQMPLYGVKSNFRALFSQTGGRFIATFNPCRRQEMEKILRENNCIYEIVGTVTDEKNLNVVGLEGKEIIKESIENLAIAYTQRFGDLV
ncbi:phosphoribosylformylglycinamidine synthase [Patescibacteria group bacterium]|nr:phosphoribosylformylglycinamidine synthase [Patescibacteria group bacterium]MBU3999701.1 phosphoribosylformylglycinamidine synthase [Patescibacteria group bacterium]MBU4056789.1 phosphoribosylformylglycinamidine synthase [Patescibacteria group bacterium]MBU4368911.1 phosphoribosylformylglycinamidine synthase [Patescibacteria group bacterium]